MLLWCFVCLCVCVQRLWPAACWLHARALDCAWQDGKSIVSGSGDKTVRVWDAATGKEVQKLEGHSSVVNSVGFSPVRACVGCGCQRCARGGVLRSAACVCGACGWVRLRVRVRIEAGGTSRLFIGACAFEHAISIFNCVYVRVCSE